MVVEIKCCEFLTNQNCSGHLELNLDPVPCDENAPSSSKGVYFVWQLDEMNHHHRRKLKLGNVRLHLPSDVAVK